MPTMKVIITRPCLAIDLPGRHMRVEIGDDGTVRVIQKAYDLMDGAASTPENEDAPRYVPGGEYEFTLPECVDVNEICDTGGIPPSSSRFPAKGTFTIAATHWHG